MEETADIGSKVSSGSGTASNGDIGAALDRYKEEIYRRLNRTFDYVTIATITAICTVVALSASGCGAKKGVIIPYKAVITEPHYSESQSDPNGIRRSRLYTPGYLTGKGVGEEHPPYQLTPKEK